VELVGIFCAVLLISVPPNDPVGPQAGFGVLRLVVDEGAFGDFEALELPIDFAPCRWHESGADACGEVQIFAAVESNDQRVE
jgi:hypothetical protein